MMVVLKNLSQNTVIADDLKITSSLLDQALGLLRKSNPRALLFKTRFGIHTFGLTEVIDVVVLDKNWQIVKLATVLPNQLFFWNPKFNLIIELPKKTIQNAKLGIGDTLEVG